MVSKADEPAKPPEPNTADAAPASNEEQPEWPFWKLPYELRLTIYELVFDAHDYQWANKKRSNVIRPRMLGINKRLRAETVKAFYEQLVKMFKVSKKDAEAAAARVEESRKDSVRDWRLRYCDEWQAAYQLAIAQEADAREGSLIARRMMLVEQGRLLSEGWKFVE